MLSPLQRLQVNFFCCFHLALRSQYIHSNAVKWGKLEWSGAVSATITWDVYQRWPRSFGRYIGSKQASISIFYGHYRPWLPNTEWSERQILGDERKQGIDGYEWKDWETEGFETRVEVLETVRQTNVPKLLAFLFHDLLSAPMFYHSVWLSLIHISEPTRPY